MSGNIEKIGAWGTRVNGEWKKDVTGVYRTTCQCMSEEHDQTFYVNVDERMVFLEVEMNTCSVTSTWESEWYKRWPKTIWKRVKVALKVLFTGYIETEASFIFRDDGHLEDYIKTLNEATMIARGALEEKKDGE